MKYKHYTVAKLTGIDQEVGTMTQSEHCVQLTSKNDQTASITLHQCALLPQQLTKSTDYNNELHNPVEFQGSDPSLSLSLRS